MIRTPYPELVVDTNARLAAIIAWNAAQERAKVEYHLHPIAACSVATCERLVSSPAGRLCPSHSHAYRSGRAA